MREHDRRVLGSRQEVFVRSNREAASFARVRGSRAQSAGVMITAGVVIATLSAPRKPSSRASTTEATPGIESDAWLYVWGITLLSVALVVSSLLGLWQEETYARYGKQWREGLFYSVSWIMCREMKLNCRSTFSHCRSLSRCTRAYRPPPARSPRLDQCHCSPCLVCPTCQLTIH